MNSNPLTDIQRSVFDIIKTKTKANPITGLELTKAVKIADEKQKRGANMRSIINTLRDKGYPVCASSNGYYYPQSKQDLKEYIDEFQNRIFEQQKACDSLKIALNNWDNVEVLGFNIITIPSGGPFSKISENEYLFLGSNNKSYKIKVDNRYWSCECESFRFGRGKECKHIAEIKGFLKKAEEELAQKRQNKLII